MDWLGFLVIGLSAGWLAGRLTKGGFGVAGDLLAGALGALLGGLFFRLLAPHPWGVMPESLAGAAVGAVVLLLLLRLIKRA